LFHSHSLDGSAVALIPYCVTVVLNILFAWHLQEYIAAQLADRSNVEKYLTTVQNLYTK